VNLNNRNVMLWGIIIMAALAMYNLVIMNSTQSDDTKMIYSDFVKSVDNNQVDSVTLYNNSIEGKLTNGKTFFVNVPLDLHLVDRLLNHNVKVESSDKSQNENSFLKIFLRWLPELIFLGVWIFFMRQMQSGNNKAMGFGKSKAKLLTEAQGKITFNDVAGVDEAKQEVEEIVDFLKDPRKFQKLGGRIPKGVLLMGSPGTGKTLLARAIAGEAGVPFFSISGSDFVEMFVGVGASRVRDLFEQGKKNAPCIIFIDEIDAVGRHRGAGMGGGNDEREQTLNQLLVEMDGFEASEGVILIAATNRPDVLDKALLRPGRFDRQVVVPLPDINGREGILKVHTQKIPLGNDVIIRTIARGTPGFSGADLANLVNEAALIAARQNKRVVTHHDFEEARDKVLMGPERRTTAMSEHEKEMTAYHEAGHAIVGFYTPGSDPIHKATIIPRGRALGMVMRLPEADQVSQTRQQMTAILALGMGGRIAEELIYGYDQITSGAASDISNATSLAHAMVTQWGMSDKLGPVFYNTNHERANSDITVQIIDDEVRRLVEEGLSTAREVLTQRIDQLHLLTKYLLEHETLTGEDIAQILNEGILNRQEKAPDTPVRTRPTMPNIKKGSTATPSRPTAKPKQSPNKPATKNISGE